MADATSGGKRWLIAPTVGLAAFMEVLDISIANVALQHIAGSLAASLDEATWVLTSYLVANAIVLPMSGWLAGAIGRRRYFLGCIAGFSVTSLLCGLAPSLPLLIVARALQGITGGGLQPNSQAILADAFPPNKRGQAFAIYGISVVFAPAIGPTLGGWITDNFSWRWVFLLNVPVGALLSLLAARVIVDPPERVAALKTRFKQGLRFDTIGFAFLVIGMCALQVVLDKGQEDDWWSSAFITDLAVVAAVALTAFVIWELRRPDPIVDLRLLANRNFAFGNILMFMVGFVLLSSTVLLPLYAQAVLGYTATEAGKVISPGGFAVMLMMPIVGMLVGRVDARWLIAFGLVATSLALFNMMRFDTNVDYATLAWARIYQSIGLAITTCWSATSRPTPASTIRPSRPCSRRSAGTPRAPPTRCTRRRRSSMPWCSGRRWCFPTLTPSGCWPSSSPPWCRSYCCCESPTMAALVCRRIDAGEGPGSLLILTGDQVDNWRIGEP